MFEYKKNKAIKEYITKKGEKRYSFQIYLGLNKVTKKPLHTTKRGFKTPALANAAYLKIESQVKNDTYNSENKNLKQLTFKDVFDDWWKNQYSTSVKTSTRYKTEQVFNNHILPKIGDMQIDKITSAILQRYTPEWNTIYTHSNVIVQYTKRVFDFAYSKSYIDKNPFDKIIIPKKHKSIRTKDNFFSTSELNKFIDFILNNSNIDGSGEIEYKKALFFYTLAFTGMRKGELLALEWSDIDFDKLTIDINKSLITNEKGKLDVGVPKWDSFRKISISKSLRDKLKEYHTHNQNSVVFSKDDGTWYGLKQPNSWLNTIIDQGTVTYKLLYSTSHDEKYKEFVPKITPHGFRHTHATWLFEKNPSLLPKTVQERLGHKSISVTLNIYTHVSSMQNDLLSDILND